MSGRDVSWPFDDELAANEETSLAELVNRVLDKGAVVSGEVVISVAGVDLIYLSLRLLLSSVEAMRGRHEPGGFF
jgi:gas vesicle structural protein